MQTSSQKNNAKASATDQFSTSGFILAAIGSAVGLGNMWKFPYITGQYGGAAFFLLFFCCLLFVGLPILLAEMAIGRSGRGNAVSSFYALSQNKIWGKLGFLTVLTPFLILSFYAIVAGWTLHYATISLTGGLFNVPDYTEAFVGFASGYMPLFWQVVTMALTCFVVVKGISGGIEKFNKVLIPGLGIILIVLMIRSLTLPGAAQGVDFFLNPDFSKLGAESALVALGHAFFSLSLGMGAMLTYGAYVRPEQSLGKATLAIGAGDLLYAFIAGLIIFPTAFSYGIEPSQGAGLVFMALPAAFAAMPFGNLFGFLFFILLAIAALTSMVSLLEVPVAYAMNRWNVDRKKATILVTIAVFLLGVPSALAMGPLADFTIFGKNFFDFMDFITANIMLPLGGLIVTLFTGYAWKRVGEETGISGFWYNVWMFLLRYVAPIMVVLIFAHSLGLIQF
nr:sodium-dependent transporter [Brevibacillus dissolubilis]